MSASCPLCGASSSFAFTAEDRNRRLSSERFDYHRCEACKTVFLAEPPEDPARHYGSAYHPFDAHGQPRWRAQPGVIAAQAWRVAQLRRLLGGGGSLIDIGAGAGAFAQAASERGFAVSAIEMDPACCAFIERELHIPAICTDRPLQALAELAPARAVCLWHVLEHLPAPGEVLDAAARALEPGGVLALALPNPRSIQFRLLGRRWAHLDAPRHLSLIPAEALLARARELGLAPLLQTSADPDGLACNVHGWVYALRPDPATGEPGWPALRTGAQLAALLAPLERRGGRGAALTLFLGKPPLP